MLPGLVRRLHWDTITDIFGGHSLSEINEFEAQLHEHGSPVVDSVLKNIKLAKALPPIPAHRSAVLSFFSNLGLLILVLSILSLAIYLVYKHLGKRTSIRKQDIQRIKQVITDFLNPWHHETTEDPAPVPMARVKPQPPPPPPKPRMPTDFHDDPPQLSPRHMSDSPSPRRHTRSMHRRMTHHLDEPREVDEPHIIEAHATVHGH